MAEQLNSEIMRFLFKSFPDCNCEFIKESQEELQRGQAAQGLLEANFNRSGSSLRYDTWNGIRSLKLFY